MKSKIIILITLGILFALAPMITVNLSFITDNSNKSSDYSDVINLDNENLKLSKVSGKIHIDNNWSAVEAAGICTGTGTYSDPYVIEDLVIDGGGSGSNIWIENSKDCFKIENCTLYNAQEGIFLANTGNGTIFDNKIYNIIEVGIKFGGSCNNNTILFNNITKCNQGLDLSGGYNYDNVILKNHFIDNAARAITITENSDNNTLHYNYFFYNGLGSQANDDGTNNKWDNGSIGNYWSDYNGFDNNGNGIGDIPYYYIGGSSNSQDNYPIFYPEPKPSVFITNHNNNDNVNGTTLISINALSPYGIARIEFWINGFLKWIDNSNPYTFLWDTTLFIDDSYLLEVIAIDYLGQRNSTWITLNVNNGLPSVNITSHVDQEIVSGLQTIEVTAVSPIGIDRVEFWINGFLKWIDNSEPYNFIWNTTKVLDDAYLLEVVAVDSLRQKNSEWMILNNNNGISIDDTDDDTSVIPGYNLFFLLGILSVVVFILSKKLKKS